jgi:tight adherence protein B
VVIDLVAAVVEAGVPPVGAIRLVSGCLCEAGDPSGEDLASGGAGSSSGGGEPAPVGEESAPSGPGAADWRPLFDALDLAASCGLGPVGLIRSAATEQRRRRAEALAVAARRLAVLAVVPTTLCLLPAFVLLTVVPLVLDLLPGR